MKKVEIYTDGACSGNPGPGGWAGILMYGKHKKEISGYESDTTNNRMELLAAIYSLDILKEPCNVSLYSDSAYLINALTQDWLEGWKKNGWTRGKKKEELKNKDLWERIDYFNQYHDINWVKVKGHSDNAFNNRCDELAVTAIKDNV